ncbi:MAG: type II secretion system protein [Candidatus Lindowbacteria bacterium]|nr:type II secretion system protein [Candidatus Lindowbacteria bacterium]
MEILVVISILGIFMGIAIPSVMRSFRAMSQAKKLTSRYPDTRKALEKMSDMLRRTFPAAIRTGGSFVGSNGSYDFGGVMIPADQLSFPALDTGYAHVSPVQRISFKLDLSTPEIGHPPEGLVETRSLLSAPAEAGVRESLSHQAVGLDFSYLDGSKNPPEWVQQWPPDSATQAAAPIPAPAATPGAAAVGQPPLQETVPQPVNLPSAVKITVFILGGVSPQPTSFFTIVNVPSR